MKKNRRKKHALPPVGKIVARLHRTTPQTLPSPQAKEPSADNEPLLIGEITDHDEMERRKAGMAPARRLYGDLWYEGELCVLFADTNVGKSIMAVQVAYAIATGRERHIPDMALECEPHKVLYADFELSERQFYKRYTDGNGTLHPFGSNFHRFSIRHDDFTEQSGPEDFSEQVLHDIELSIRDKGFRTVIIDNITYMANGTEKSADALPLMKRLIKMKTKYGVSMLVLAHTPKRSASLPLDRNDLQGSKMIINFVDSAFALGDCWNVPGKRYLKQIKTRSGEQVYGADNVIELRLEKDEDADEAFLHLQFQGYGPESSQLRPKSISTAERGGMEDRIMALRREQKSVREIAELTGRSKATVSRIINGNQWRERTTDE